MIPSFDLVYSCCRIGHYSILLTNKPLIDSSWSDLEDILVIQGYSTQLLTQVISCPYISSVRGNNVKENNVLNLGPLHCCLKNHLKLIIEDPDILLATATESRYSELEQLTF